jgi:hypothetical protein
MCILNTDPDSLMSVLDPKFWISFAMTDELLSYLDNYGGSYGGGGGASNGVDWWGS